MALRAAGAGFAAVAAGMARVRDAVVTIQGGLGNLAGLISEATRATMAVPEGVSPQDTINGLAPVQTAVDGVRDAATETISQVDGAQRLVVMALQGGQPGPLLQALATVKEVLVLVTQQTGTTRQHIETAITEARQLGASGN